MAAAAVQRCRDHGHTNTSRLRPHRRRKHVRAPPAAGSPAAAAPCGVPLPRRPNNTLTLPTDTTEIQYVRDHLNTTIYMRTAGTPRWVQIHLPAALQAAEAAGGGPRFTPVAELAPPDEPWALDRSAMAGGSKSS